MQEIIIQGTTGVGKSLYAEGLERIAIEAGYAVELSDHALFTSHVTFKSDLAKIQEAHKKSAGDISILVINNNARDLQITFTNGVSHRLACAIFVGMD